MKFTGFSKKGIELLSKLPSYDADQYTAVKSELADGIRTPGAALIETVANKLPVDLTVSTRSSVSPLHRDLRFAAPGTPRYKEHLMLTTWSGEDKKTGATLWMRIGADGVGFASGIGFTPAARTKWREAVGGDEGAALAEHIEKVLNQHAAHGAQVAGDATKRVPKPWDEDHPRADLLRLKGFQLRFLEPLPGSVDQPEFADWCTERLAELLPVHNWLVAHIQEAS